VKALLSLLVLTLALPVAARADDMERYLELLRSDLRNAKTELHTEALRLSDAEGAKFWPIQREYEVALAKIADQRVTLIKDYAANYDQMTPEMANSLMDRAFKLEKSRVSLLEKYAKKVSKEVSPTTGARFAQVEAIVNSLVDLQIRSETPLVPKVKAAAAE
jgi:hypothetical protein